MKPKNIINEESSIKITDNLNIMLTICCIFKRLSSNSKKKSNNLHYYFFSNFTAFGDFPLEPCWGRLLNLKGHRVRSGQRRHPKLTTTKFTGTSAVCVSHIAAPSEPLVALTEPGNGSRSRPALAALSGCGKYIF